MKARRTGKALAPGKRAATGSGQLELPGISDPPRPRRLKPPAEISGFGLAAIPVEAATTELATDHRDTMRGPGNE